MRRSLAPAVPHVDARGSRVSGFFTFRLELPSTNRVLRQTLPATTVSICRVAWATGAFNRSVRATATMEPPAKRLRILQSVEVDETNPKYIEAKQKQQQKFKSRLERIFDKYGNMHESMSDEIDFKTGKVVVDRGHIRRVQRQMQRNGPSLVDNLLEPALAQAEDSEEEEGQFESEDELAPTQTARKERSVEDKERAAQPSWQQNTPVIARTPQTVSVTLPQRVQIPNTPNQATDLYQQIQQTPLDQQTQAALVANLNQIQAAQQALASLLSILQSTPNGQTPLVPNTALPPQTSASDNVRPAADPRWYFPPISAVKEVPPTEPRRSSPPPVDQAPQQTECPYVPSSPPVPRRKSPKVRIQKRPSTISSKQNPQSRQEIKERPSSLHTPAVPSNLNVDTDTVSTDTPTRKAKRIRSTREYVFTEEDCIYIRKMTEVNKMTLKDVKESKPQWSDWPLSMFYSRWQGYRKERKLHPQKRQRIGATADQNAPSPPEHDEHFFSSIEIPETSSAEHRLPTPNSLAQDSARLDRAVLLSSSHFDDDELDLLSLAGDALSIRSSPGDEDYPTPDEPLPSIEGAEFRNEDDLQFEMLKAEQSPTPAPNPPPGTKPLPSTIPETQESLIAASPPPTIARKPVSASASRSSKPAAPKATLRAVSTASSDIDLIGPTDDKSTTPCATYIKRESLTPLASTILCSSPVATLKTPRPFFNPLSSGVEAKSTGKLNRRAYLNDVKKSWAKGKGRTPGSQAKKRGRMSLGGCVKEVTRARVGGESEDELAL